jgi:hypothetical protein
MEDWLATAHWESSYVKEGAAITQGIVLKR